MSERSEKFIDYLSRLHAQDRGAMAVLRRSLAFAPGSWPPSYPYIERFVAADWHAHDAKRLALYAVAGLFARHPQMSEHSLAYALGIVMHKRESPSIEQRFITLLGADANNIVHYLRQIISLLAAEAIGLNYVRLLDDLQRWMDPQSNPDSLRQHWARDFYRALTPISSPNEESLDEPAQTVS